MLLKELQAVPDTALPLALLRAHLRLGSGFDIAPDTVEDAVLSGYLRAAITAIEARTGKVLLSRRFRLVLEDWRDRMGQALPFAPVETVHLVAIKDSAGVIAALPAADWHLLTDRDRPVIRPGGLILPHVARSSSVVIEFTAGFGPEWAEVPADLAHAVLMLAAQFYDDRSGTIAAPGRSLPVAVAALVERWRVVRTLVGRRGESVR